MALVAAAGVSLWIHSQLGMIVPGVVKRVLQEFREGAFALA
jgi:hypothetical protein